MLLGGIIIAGAAWLWNRLTQYRHHIIEEVAPFFQALDWEEVEAAFDWTDPSMESQSTWQKWFGGSRDYSSRHDLAVKIGLAQEFVQRMDHNARVAEITAANDWRSTFRSRKHREKESEELLCEVPAMLEAAQSFEHDAELPENAGQADEFRLAAAQLRAEAQALLDEEDGYQKMHAEHLRTVAEARRMAFQFRAHALLQHIKFDLVLFVLHLDLLRVLPVHGLAAHGCRKTGHLLRRYQELKEKVAAHARSCGQDEEVLAHM
jgi:hypothetical protein